MPQLPVNFFFTSLYFALPQAQIEEVARLAAGHSVVAVLAPVTPAPAPVSGGEPAPAPLAGPRPAPLPPGEFTVLARTQLSLVVHVEVRQGDFKQCAAGCCLVNPSNNDMRHGAGLAAAIDKAAGAKYVAHAASLAPLATGDAKWSPSYNLRGLRIPSVIHTGEWAAWSKANSTSAQYSANTAKSAGARCSEDDLQWVGQMFTVHCAVVVPPVAPFFSSDSKAIRQTMQKCVKSVMTLALTSGIAEVAICGLGAGAFKWDPGA